MNIWSCSRYQGATQTGIDSKLQKLKNSRHKTLSIKISTQKLHKKRQNVHTKIKNMWNAQKVKNQEIRTAGKKCTGGICRFMLLWFASCFTLQHIHTPKSRTHLWNHPTINISHQRFHQYLDQSAPDISPISGHVTVVRDRIEYYIQKNIWKGHKHIVYKLFL